MAIGMSLKDLSGTPRDQEAGMMQDDINPIIAAAQSTGFDVRSALEKRDWEGILGAAAKSDMGATDGGIAHIVGMSKSLGVRSPWHRDFGRPPSEMTTERGPQGRPRPLQRGYE